MQAFWGLLGADSVKPTYREVNDFENRKSACQSILDKHIGRIPIIVSSSSVDLKKHKFLVPDDMIVIFFHNFIRRSLNMTPDKALFTYVEVVDSDSEKCSDSILPSTNMTFRDLYSQHKHTDGFLYMAIELENTFG